MTEADYCCFGRALGNREMFMPTTPDTRSLDREAVRLANPSVGGVAWPTIAFGIAIAVGYGLTFLAAARPAEGETTHPQPGGPRPKGTEDSGTLVAALCKPSPASQPVSQPASGLIIHTRHARHLRQKRHI